MTFSISTTPFQALDEGPLIIGQLGQSLDGRIATNSGHSRYINRSGALDHLHMLRSQVDAVIVGVGTVIADNPRLTVRRVSGPNPARIILDPKNRAPEHSLCFVEDGARRLVFSASARSRAPGIETVLIPPGENGFSPHVILAELNKRGMNRVLIEGGALTVSRFIAADALDHLHLLMAPMVIGSGLAGVSLPPIDLLSSARRPTATLYPLGGEDILIACNLRKKWDFDHE